MTRFQIIERDARDAVIAARLQGGPEPKNPWRRATTSNIRWDMAARRAERAVSDLLRIGA